jgi:acyl-coenzyme A thioesterase PaaI-like protein
VCGKENKQGLRLGFKHSKNLLKTVVVFQKQHQGYKDIVHGGMVAIVLDEMMVNLSIVEGMPAVTAELLVRLKKPTKVGEKIYFESRLEKHTPRVVYASSVAKNSKGDVLASATATCVRIKGDTITLDAPKK